MKKMNPKHKIIGSNSLFSVENQQFYYKQFMNKTRLG